MDNGTSHPPTRMPKSLWSGTKNRKSIWSGLIETHTHWHMHARTQWLSSANILILQPTWSGINKDPITRPWGLNLKKVPEVELLNRFAFQNNSLSMSLVFGSVCFCGEHICRLSLLCNLCLFDNHINSWMPTHMFFKPCPTISFLVPFQSGKYHFNLKLKTNLDPGLMMIGQTTENLL